MRKPLKKLLLERIRHPLWMCLRRDNFLRKSEQLLYAADVGQAVNSVSLATAALGGASVVMLLADADAAPKQASRFGLVGRLARERTNRPVRPE